MADFGKVNAIYSKYFTIDHPARSCVAVAQLPKGAKFEIETIFFNPDITKKVTIVSANDDFALPIQKSLYERLGGAAAIDAVVKGMYEKIFYDEDLKDFFRKTDKPNQMQAMNDFLTTATGGPKVYKGKDMKSAHVGRGITDKEFDLVISHVVDTMKELEVPGDLINEVGALVSPLRGDVTE